MAKVYRTKYDVSIAKPVALLDPSDEKSDEVTEGATYPAGSLISEAWLTRRERARAANGELDHLLEPADDQALPEGYVNDGVFNPPERGVFIAEHEAEATALEAGGHIVVPDDQKMESLSASLPHQRGYQEAVHEHGLDRRPVLEKLQEPRPRVPDEVLYGAETPTGIPHNRGTDESFEQNLEDHRERNREESEEAKAGVDDSYAEPESTRPAPGAEGRQEADSQTVG